MVFPLRAAWAALVLVLALSPRAEAQDEATAAKVRQAAGFMQAGRPDEAIPLYRELAAAFPGVPSFGINVAIAQFKAGRYREAIAQCDSMLKLRPDLFSAWLFLGASYAALRQPERAVEPLRKAVELNPEDRNARVMLADALLADRQYAGAAAQFEEAARRMPENPRVWQGQGRSYDALAAELFDKLSRAAPEAAETAALAGDMERDRGQWARAYERYRRALALRPGLTGLHAAVAEIYEKTGHPDWAATERAREPQAPPADCGSPSIQCDFSKGLLREVANAAEEMPAALYLRVRAARELARRAWAKLDELPASPERYEAVALARERSGRWREAAEAWKEALDRAPGNVDFQRQLAIALCRSNDCGSALSLIKKLLDSEPASAEWNYLYGTALGSTQSTAQALPYLEAAVKLDAKLTAARAALGAAYLEAGSPERAIPELEASLADDEDGARRYQLARAYQAVGKADQAGAMLRAYREILARKEAQAKAEPVITPPATAP
ncbi:MAG TPA: tetratricopeptide repeat protein [Bryobacteraceae bacterium]|nr:tetratricopeptide repeat protein [Bryobacteraceae bacterium]